MIATESLPVCDRSEVAFSSNGRYAVCVRSDNAGRALESWALSPGRARCRSVRRLAETSEICALPLNDGRILGLQLHEDDHLEMGVLQPTAGPASVRRLGRFPATLGGYLLPSPDSDALALVVCFDDATQSTVWRVSETQLVAVARVPGNLHGGAWVGPDMLVLNQNCEDCRCAGIVLDVSDGAWRRIWSVSDTSIDQIALASPHSKLLVLTTNAAGEGRLGWARLGEPTVHFPDILHRPGYLRRALALDDRGERVLLAEECGTRSRLAIFSPATDRLDPLPGPEGVVTSAASWVRNSLRMCFSAPNRPATLATARLGSRQQWSFGRGHEADDRTWTQAELVELDGPTGPIEAIVYGGPGWLDRPHLVLALHGGPLSAWRFEFDALFQALSAAGVAVVAPNYRGSTGYGEGHLRSVIGNWGGPDLADVLHLARGFEYERRPRRLPRSVVLGASYGAFLALLAACEDPTLWSACVALAPFLSGTRLFATSDAAVRHRTEHLGGLDAGPDRQRDVLRSCASLSAPLLLMHAVDDLTVPVEHSRTLRRRLLELGRSEGFDLEYVEVDGGHEVVARAGSQVLRDRVVRFCLGRLLGEAEKSKSA